MGSMGREGEVRPIRPEQLDKPSFGYLVELYYFVKWVLTGEHPDDGIILPPARTGQTGDEGIGPIIGYGMERRGVGYLHDRLIDFSLIPIRSDLDSGA